MEKRRVLFLCTGNTSRSIMGEAILRQVAGDRFEAHSAGLSPSEVRPEALAVLGEAGFDTSGLHSKPVDDYLGHMFIHFLITVCDQAEQNCPRIWPQGGERIFWPVEDPAIVDGVEATRLEAFRRARDDMRARIEAWVAEHSED
jgi:arsenate reductase